MVCARKEMDVKILGSDGQVVAGRLSSVLAVYGQHRAEAGMSCVPACVLLFQVWSIPCRRIFLPGWKIAGNPVSGASDL